MLRAHEQKACAAILAVASVMMLATHWRRGPTQFVDNEPLAAGRTMFRVAVNEAPWTEWAMLPGIGRTLAQRIVEHRETAGPFRSLTDLLDVRGIGPRKLEAMRPFLVFRRVAKK